MTVETSVTDLFALPLLRIVVFSIISPVLTQGRVNYHCTHRLACLSRNTIGVNFHPVHGFILLLRHGLVKILVDPTKFWQGE